MKIIELIGAYLLAGLLLHLVWPVFVSGFLPYFVEAGYIPLKVPYWPCVAFTYLWATVTGRSENFPLYIKPVP